MEGLDRQSACAVGIDHSSPFGHLLGGAIGECQTEDTSCGDALTYRVRDTLCQHTSLTRSDRRHHEDWSLDGVDDRLLLIRWVERLLNGHLAPNSPFNRRPR